MAPPPSKARAYACRAAASAFWVTPSRCFPAQVAVLVVGAGPTGLGVATRLNQRGHPDWALIDQARRPGARAAARAPLHAASSQVSRLVARAAG